MMSQLGKRQLVTALKMQMEKKKKKENAGNAVHIINVKNMKEF